MSDIVEWLREANSTEWCAPMLEKAADEIERLRREVQEARAVLHYSDCAVNNAPAFPPGPCDCGGVPVADEIERLRRERDEAWAKALDEAADALEGWGDIYGDNAARTVRALKDRAP